MKTYSKVLNEICKACDKNVAHWYTMLEVPGNREFAENNLVNAMLIQNGMQHLLELTAK